MQVSRNSYPVHFVPLLKAVKRWIRKMFKKILYNVFLIFMLLFHCRAVKLPAVVRQTTYCTGAHRGGHSSAKLTGPRRSTRIKKIRMMKIR